jgi:hypothetical protein
VSLRSRSRSGAERLVFPIAGMEERRSNPLLQVADNCIQKASKMQAFMGTLRERTTIPYTTLINFYIKDALLADATCFLIFGIHWDKVTDHQAVSCFCIGLKNFSFCVDVI